MSQMPEGPQLLLTPCSGSPRGPYRASAPGQASAPSSPWGPPGPSRCHGEDAGETEAGLAPHVEQALEVMGRCEGDS